MLQLHRLSRRARDRLEAENPLPERPFSAETLSRLATERISHLRRLRQEEARAIGGLTRLREVFDRNLRTERIERLDRPEISSARKQRIVADLHDLNEMILSYRRFVTAIEPFVRRVNEREGRAARIVELACGAGELTLQLPAIAQRRGLSVSVVGTDVVPAYIEAGEAEARRRKVDVSFRLLNAFDLENQLGQGDVDVFFIAQSLHHFTPGQLALMMAGAQAVGAGAFVAVDGRRSLLLLSTIPGYALCFKSLDFAHDALLSTRKFYSEPELAVIAGLAVPDVPAVVRSSHPGYTVLTLDFAGADP